MGNFLKWKRNTQCNLFCRFKFCAYYTECVQMNFKYVFISGRFTSNIP
jgi:hypothetical protein